MSNDPRAPEYELDDLDAREAESLVRKMIETAGAVMEDTRVLAGVEFTITSIDFEGTEEAVRAVGRDDLQTKEISLQRELLSRSITRIDKRRVKPEVVEFFLRKLPPAAVRELYQGLISIREQQAFKYAEAAELVKK